MAKLRLQRNFRILWTTSALPLGHFAILSKYSGVYALTVEVGVTSNFFAYGSLMDPEIMEWVSGNSYPSVQVVLDGYLRRVVEQQVYPAVIKKKDCQVEGILWQGLSDLALTRLDSFEGLQYQRSQVEVFSHAGDRLLAETYIFRQEYSHLFSDKDWDVAFYLGKCRDAFLG